MIYKIYYQEFEARNPKRETTQSMYIDAADIAEARAMADSLPHNIEFIEELSEEALAYEQQSPSFSLTEI